MPSETRIEFIVLLSSMRSSLSICELIEMGAKKIPELLDSNTTYKLGHMYEVGEGVDKNYELAVKLYEKSIELGENEAMNNLATMYQNGYGVEQSYEKAIELYNKAIELGNSYAMHNLAVIYHNINGVEKNYEKTIELYKKAIKLGNFKSMYNLGMMYEYGEGVEQSYEKATELYEKAAKLGFITAINKLELLKDKMNKEQCTLLDNNDLALFVDEILSNEIATNNKYDILKTLIIKAFKTQNYTVAKFILEKLGNN